MRKGNQAAMHHEQEEEAEDEAVTSQRAQGGASMAVASTEQAHMKMVENTTIDQGEMDSIHDSPNKKEAYWEFIMSKLVIVKWQTHSFHIPEALS